MLFFFLQMTTLEMTETEDSTAAVLSLLAMGIKTVPQEVLRVKFPEASKSFLDLLARFSEGENAVILRSVSSYYKNKKH